MRGVRLAGVAAVREVHRPGRPHHAALVRAVRPTLGGDPPLVLRLSTDRDRRRAGSVPLPGADRRGDPGDEVLGVARPGTPSRRRHGRGRSGPPRRRGDVGPAPPAATGSAWVRPGRGDRAKPGPSPRSPSEAAAHPDPGHARPGPSGRLGPSPSPPGRVQGGVLGAGPSAARRRRPHHRRHRSRLRSAAPCVGRPNHLPRGGGPLAGRPHPGALPRRWPLRASPATIERARAWVCGCPGERPPVVDASRRRNDPRKATVGC
jgi:hypothetical protein